ILQHCRVEGLLQVTGQQQLWTPKGKAYFGSADPPMMNDETDLLERGWQRRRRAMEPDSRAAEDACQSFRHVSDECRNRYARVGENLQQLDGGWVVSGKVREHAFALSGSKGRRYLAQRPACRDDTIFRVSVGFRESAYDLRITCHQGWERRRRIWKATALLHLQRVGEKLTFRRHARTPCPEFGKAGQFCRGQHES